MSEKLPSHQKFPTRKALVGLGALGLAGILTGCTIIGGTHQQNPTQPDKNGVINVLGGQFSYLPGAQMKPDGLLVDYRNFKIVEQDGSGGQDNPPINAYGTHLKIAGGFAVNATLKHVKGQASLDMYGEVPPISDEFRVETPRVRLSVESGNFTVEEWDGSDTDNLAHQAPTLVESAPIDAGGEVDISMADQNGELTFSAGDHELLQVPDHGTFDSGELYFGADTGTDKTAGSYVLGKLTAKPLNGGHVEAVDLSAQPAFTKDPNSLQMLASKKRPGFLIGGNVAPWAMTDPQYRKIIFGGNFGIVTPENAMKWQATEPRPGVFDFHEADAIVDEARKNGMEVHGHNLVFGEALPKWVSEMPAGSSEEKAAVKAALVRHVKTLVSHFKGRVHEWDINEIFADYNDSDEFPQLYKDNVFYRAMNADYVTVAIQTAIAVDPQLKIWVNDYGAETDTDARWQGIFGEMKRLKVEKRLPIYGFGFQAHNYDPETDDIAEVTDENGKTTLENHINAFAGIKVESRISEADAPAQSAQYDGSSQAQQLSGILRICITNQHCKAFSTWSIGSTDMSQTDARKLENSAVDSPWNQKNLPTRTYKILQDALR